jgi:hypothetical protein
VDSPQRLRGAEISAEAAREEKTGEAMAAREFETTAAIIGF